MPSIQNPANMAPPRNNCIKFLLSRPLSEPRGLLRKGEVLSACSRGVYTQSWQPDRLKEFARWVPCRDKDMPDHPSQKLQKKLASVDHIYATPHQFLDALDAAIRAFRAVR